MATIPTGKFVWFEYVSNNEKKAQAFFGELFHWKTKDMPMPQGSYSMIALGGETIGGYLPPSPRAPQHAHWVSHLQVANVQEIAMKVKSLGGTITKEATKMGDAGTMAVVTDPLGGVFALWQPAKPEVAGDDYKNTDGSWIWNELYTEDPEKSAQFYKTIGGFEIETLTTGGRGPNRYEILKSAGKGRAGIMKMSGVAQMWMPYVKVASTDAAIDKAKKLGASVKVPAETMPDVGRLAVLIDPLGAPIGILQPAM